MIFYYPDASESKRIDEFLEFYNKVYFYVARNINLESNIESIYEKNILDLNDYRNILLWKTGGRLLDETTISYRDQFININEVYEVCKKIDKNNINENIQSILCNLKEISGVGNVIAIALLSFITNGELPIYDKYAHIALLKIDNGCKECDGGFKKLITDKELYQKFHNSDNIKTVYNEYNKYKDLLYTYFKDYLDKGLYRKVDRALWSYGHLFNDIITNKNRG